MKKIKIVTDSTVDLTEDVLQKYDIEMVSLSLHIDGETYLDRVELEHEEFLEKMKVSQELPKTSQPSVGSFMEVYHRLGSNGYEVISIHMTGEMSGTVQAARTAASMTNTKVTVVDSEYISKAMSFQVIEAAKMAQEGKCINDITMRLKNIRHSTRLIIAIDSLENLKKGGRIGSIQSFLGSLLKIKPVAVLKNGSLQPLAKLRSYSQVIEEVLKRISKDTEGENIKEIAIVHVDALNKSRKLKERIKEKFTDGVSNISIETTTPVISTHAGVGAIAVMYHWG